jgi:hypothetical protein
VGQLALRTYIIQVLLLHLHHRSNVKAISQASIIRKLDREVDMTLHPLFHLKPDLIPNPCQPMALGLG